MATRSFIGIQNTNGSVTGVYCHHDGYLEGVGATLTAHYTTAEQVRELVALGSLSSLGEDLDVTQAYHRDRGEDLDVANYGSPGQIRFSDGDYEFLYVFTPEGWLVAEGHSNSRTPKFRRLG